MKVSIIAAAVLVVIGSLIVWLNIFQFRTESDQTVRINRFTSQICYSQPDGTWNSNQHPTGLTDKQAIEENYRRAHENSQAVLAVCPPEGLPQCGKAILPYPDLEHHRVKADAPNKCK
jgi:hypothetical protein